MIKIKDTYCVPKALLQQVVNLIRACQPVGGVSNGDVVDVMGMLAACIQEQEEPEEKPKEE